MTDALKTRFARKDDLVAALTEQTLVLGDRAVAQALAEEGELDEFAPGQQLIEQGAVDRDVYFLLLGSAMVIVNGVRLYPRERNMSVGEMAAIHPGLTRTATLEANEPTVAWRVSSDRVQAVADTHPRLWQRLAMEIARRLEQRNRFVKRANPKPKLFMICSAEVLHIAKAIRLGLEHSGFTIELWSDPEIFESGSYPLENLEREVNDSDFALALAEPDDLVRSRDREAKTPRDNVIFELGFFMSRLGRARTFLLVPRGTDVRLPSDFKGLTPIGYVANGTGHTLTQGLAPTVDRLEILMREKGVRASLLEAK
jgi:predicted nucleotide-binding protein